MNLSSDKKRFLKVGYVAGTHGIRGALLIKSEKKDWISPARKVYFDNYKTLSGPFLVKSVRQHKGYMIAEIDGISGIDEAEQFTGNLVGVKIKVLPKDTWWSDELTGCEIYDESGEKIGVVEEVLKTGANDVLVSGDILIPALKSIIKSVDIGGKRIVIKNMPGLIEKTNED